MSMPTIAVIASIIMFIASAAFAIFMATRKNKASKTTTVPFDASTLPAPADLFAQAMQAIESEGAKKALAEIVDAFAKAHSEAYKAKLQGVVNPVPKDPQPAA